MSCCGQKRLAFKQELNASPRYEAESSGSFQPVAEKKPRVFEYTGNQHLLLKGVSSGIDYHFRAQGEKLEVDYYDSFAMMAERDLRVAG